MKIMRSYQNWTILRNNFVRKERFVQVVSWLHKEKANSKILKEENMLLKRHIQSRSNELGLNEQQAMDIVCKSESLVDKDSSSLK